MRVLLCCLAVSLMPSAAWAFAPSMSRTASRSTALAAEQQPQQQGQQPTRKAFVNSLIAGAIATSVGGGFALPSLADETLPNGVAIKVLKSGDGPKPDVGELVAIRFRAFANGDQKIDDVFDTPEPYYTRLGSGGLIKGVESVLPMMRMGDRWELTIPVSYQITSCGSVTSPNVALRRSDPLTWLLLFIESPTTGRFGLWSERKTGCAWTFPNSCECRHHVRRRNGGFARKRSRTHRVDWR